MLGSITVYLHVSDKTFKTLCQVTDTDDCFLMGRVLARAIGYVDYPEIKPPIKYEQCPRTNVKAAQVETSTLDDEQTPNTHRKAEQIQNHAVHSDQEFKCSDNNLISERTLQLIQETINHISSKLSLHEDTPRTPQKVHTKLHNQQGNPKVTVNDKEHSLPTTKEYILREYADVFTGIGTLPGPAYHIELKDDYTPVRNPPRSVPIGMQDAYKAELERLQQEEVIIEVDHYTEWVNSIVPVQKPDGYIRLCIDPRNLNMAIKRNPYYMRTLDDILPQLSKAKTISMSDATSGYWHVPLDLASSLLTTFSTPYGKFRWLRLPFGLKIASDIFQERLDKVLALVPNTVGIADDIIVYGENEIEHDASFLTLCETARVNGLKLNSKKLQFKSDDCKFFGHKLTPQGLKADENKIEAITQMDPPKTESDLKSFLGMVNYLGRYTAALAELRPPLDRLYKKDTVWRWDPEHQRAFDGIKSIISSLPVLVYFDAKADHIIQCDASKQGLGAVLLQEGQPVMYISRTLTETEQRYSNIERELLAVVFALERLNHYTAGYRVKVETDHEPLTSIWKKPISSTSSRIQRLLLRLLQYDIDIHYLPGKKNVIADALSRVSPLPPKAADVKTMNCIAENELSVNIPASKTKMEEFQDSTSKDITLCELAKMVHKGWPREQKDCPDILKPYWTYRECISLENGLLFKDDRLIIPDTEKDQILEQLHYGHYGIKRTQDRAKESVFWPGIAKDIENKVKDCSICQENSSSQTKEIMHSHDVPRGPWIKLGIDLFEHNKKQYILLVDYFSKFPVIRQLYSLNTGAVINELKRIFSETGIPEVVISDGGPQFRSEFKDFAQAWGFQHIQSSPYHHQSNGEAERFVRTVKDTLTKAYQSGQDPDMALLCYRSTPINSKLPSPAELLNSRRYKTLLPTRTMLKSRGEEREELLNLKQKQEQYYNRSAQTLPELDENMQVYVQLQPQSRDWKPATVTERLDYNKYKIRLDFNGKEYIRNRIYIKPRTNEPRRSKRTISKPSRFQDYYT